MRLLIISAHGNTTTKICDFLPRIGDNIDSFYSPLPIVKKVVLWPSKERLADYGISTNFDAIIMVE